VLCDGAPTLIDVQSGTILAAWQTTVDIPDTNYSDISVADQQLYVQRNFGDFWQHRLALEAYNLTSGQLLWSFPLQDNINEPFDVGYAAFNDSVVVWETASLRRLDGATGQIVWKSEVASQSIDALLLVNDMVLVGTNTGFIHALDFESGELLWEQDVWATIDSKATVLRFVDFTGDTLLLSNGLGLTLSDNQHVESDQPERTYTPPPPMVAVETPPNIPEITFENNLFPEPPENKADWIPLIVAFLNANEVNFGRIPHLIQQWTDNSYFDQGHPIADLNGDQQPELFLQIAAERPPDLYPPCEYPFHSAIISKNQAGEYAIAFYWRLYSVHAPNIEDSADLTGDNLPDIALAISCGGNNTSQTFLAMIGWNGSAYHFLSDTPIGIGYTNLAIPHINEAGIYELQASVGGYGVFPIQVENIYTWDNTQDQFVRTNSQLTRPQGATAFALAGAHALQQGDYAQAISHHLDVLQSLDATYKYARLSAFSEFQLVLAYVLADDFAEAERWALSRGYADQPYALVKDVFWEAFVESGDYVISAEAARRQIRLLGTQKSQLLIVTHYTDPDFISLDEIVPCKACLEKAWNYNSPYIFNP
ncbi:MAG TPA: hypothetical protein ENJ56_04120, partial [Anaerolineae bacterium]|nr:hypothetical protein [Anaerolineae bacterium]